MTSLKRTLRSKSWIPQITSTISRYSKTAQYVMMMPEHCTQYTIQQLINIEDETRRTKAVLAWEKNVKSQLNFVAVASTLVASVVGQSLAWPQTNHAHWLVFVLWYGGLFMSLWCVVIAFHLSILLSAFDANSDTAGALLRTFKRDHEEKPRKYHLWVLQVPIALFSWAVISYMIGLVVLTLRPLWTVAWDTDCWIGTLTLVYGVITFSIYYVVASTIYGRFLPNLASWSGSAFP